MRASLKEDITSDIKSLLVEIKKNLLKLLRLNSLSIKQNSAEIDAVKQKLMKLENKKLNNDL